MLMMGSNFRRWFTYAILALVGASIVASDLLLVAE
jgi:hypothetical protein